MEQVKTMDASSMRKTHHLTVGEEVGNATSHGVMMFLFLFALPYYSVRAYLQGGWMETAGIAVYMICMICMFGGSCLYHVMPYDTTWKYVFRKLDHISILLAIAGAYTPICLVLLQGWVGYTILIVEWVMVIAGVLLKSISSKSYPKLSMTIYMIMGWMAIFIIPVLIQKASWWFIGLILAGGICYTVGAIFYGRKKPFDHFIWHIAIILASILQFIAIAYFL